MDLVEQLRHFALDPEKESESRSQSGEHKSSTLCVESLVLEHGPTSEGIVTVRDLKRKQFGKLGRAKDRTKSSQS